MFLKIFSLIFLIAVLQSCEIFSSDDQQEVTEFGLYDDPVVLYGKDLDAYLEIDRSKKVDETKVFGIWAGGFVTKDRLGFKHYAYFKVEPTKFTSILVCVREEPFLAGYVQTVSDLEFYENRLYIDEANVEKGLFFSSEGTEYGCQVGPVVKQNYEFALANGKLVLRDVNTNYEMIMERYY